MLSALVGLAGCHISFSSGSSSKAPSSSTAKPAHRSPSKASRPANDSAKPVTRSESKPASKPAAKTTDAGPTRDQPADDGPTRKTTTDSGDPTRTQPTDDPERSPKIGGRNPGDSGGGNEDDGTTKPTSGSGNLTAPTKDEPPPSGSGSLTTTKKTAPPKSGSTTLKTPQ
ncbi:MAG: hypothetical protein H6712_02215 [Myxococcales bacterium]|nr:hypothetical protein [Myxococcales bacterium]MCB9712642.1 hypothetical protein [Myxococcales bacterium]